MPFPLKFATSLILLAFPLLEIALLIKAGAIIGFWPLLLVVVLTAFAGASIIRAHGLAVFSRMMRNMEQGGGGFEPMADTFLAVTGGVLLIFPGLMGDVLGALLAIRPVRAFLIHAGATGMFSGGSHRTENYEERVSTRAKRGSGATDGSGAVIIEGEYERIDDKPPRERGPEARS